MLLDYLRRQQLVHKAFYVIVIELEHPGQSDVGIGFKAAGRTFEDEGHDGFRPRASAEETGGIRTFAQGINTYIKRPAATAGRSLGRELGRPVVVFPH